MQQQKRIERRQHRPERAHAFHAAFHGEAEVAKGLEKPHTMVTGRGLGHTRESTVVPREFARFNDDTAHGRAMSADEFGRRMDADGRAPFERLAQVRAGKGVVYEQGHTCLVADRRHGFDVQHIQRRVAQGFCIQRFGFGCDGAGEIFGVRGINEHGLNAQFFEIHAKLRMRAAVQSIGSNDLVTRFTYIQ